MRSRDENAEPLRRALVLPGMHRSGTSAVAGMLVHLGADPPRNLLPADEHNAAGYWEPREIQRLNDEILASAGISWDRVEPLADGWFESPAARRLIERAVEQLQNEYGDSPLFVLKDPRIGRILPFWRAALAEFGAEPSYVITVRNPQEVAASLQARDGIAPGRGLLLWLRYTLSAELATRGAQRAFVSYEQLLRDWRSAAGRISDELAISWPRMTARTEVEIERFLSGALRHHEISPAELEQRPEVVHWIKRTFTILDAAATGTGKVKRKALDRIRSSLNDADLAYGAIVAEAAIAADAERERLGEVRAAAEADSARLREALAGAEADRDRIRDELGERAAGLDAANSRIASLDAALEEAERRRAEAEERLAAASAERDQLAAVAAERGRELAGRTTELEAERGRVADADRELREARDELDRLREHQAELEGSGAEVIALRAAEAELRESIAQRDADVARKEEELVRRGEELAAMRREVDEAAQVAAWLRHIESSRSWRITAPMRRLGAWARRLRGRAVAQPTPPSISTAAAGPADDDDPEPAAAGAAAASASKAPPGPTRHSAAAQVSIASEVRHWTNPGPAFQEFDPTIAAGHGRRARLLAFYLPQFHRIAENDRWWGQGFTEWRNVMRGLPRFAGHYQPRIPRDLGFYDLGSTDVMRRQIKLARQAGLEGFCFYYYSFNGKRLLARPTESLLADPTLDIPFCLIWANENWTRTWDGGEDDVLMHQDYNRRDDTAFVDDLQRHFDDPRYIRIQGRPLVVIYRLDIIPGGARTIERWRHLWQGRHGENPLIFLAQTFGAEDPRDYGIDGAVEFPPHKVTARTWPINEHQHFLDPEFSGIVHDYRKVVEETLSEPLPEFPLAKTVLPSWDNDARRQGAGTVLHGSSPELYEHWLRATTEIAAENPVFGEPLVFINAWNEWAEAAYLEPDVHYGAAYLNATARAVRLEPDAARKRRLLLAGHDAEPFGAQSTILHVGESLVRQFGCEVRYLLGGGGERVSDYEALGPVTVAEDPGAKLDAAEHLRDEGYRQAIVNTAAAGPFAGALRSYEFEAISLIHEMPGMIEQGGMGPSLAPLVKLSRKVVVPGRVVGEGLESLTPIASSKLVVKPQGLYKPIETSEAAGAAVRRQLGIPADAPLVLNVGAGDLRKGIDIFIQIAKLAATEAPELHFVWVGKTHFDIAHWLEQDIDPALAERLHFVGARDDVAAFYSAADALFLSSREDPFPAVVQEALCAGLPVVAFAGATGAEDLVREHGVVVDRNDGSAILAGLREATAEWDPERVARRRRVAREDFRFDEYAFELLRLLDPELKRISVIVPNYNYRRHLGERLVSIFDQTHPIFELIVLDDGSDDGSLEELARIADQTGRRFEVVTSDENSGSVFRQWLKGCELARGELVWIAEADDLSKPTFLERLVEPMRDARVGFAFSDSSQIDASGESLGGSYRDYYRTAAGDLLDHDFVLDGKEFVRRCLAQRNLLLNASAVLWDRECLREVLADHVERVLDYKLVGDWHLYAAAALTGRKVAYRSEPLNVHRRHPESVTDSLDKRRHLDEVRAVQASIAEWIDADGGTVGRMRSYEQELERQFGLDR